ncbi:hypothetical protein [Haloarcula onubensis]|uniref:Uncharacterized protein n=1 Tax=Haloarcula onubensis TaxID=2950539 RepID=A0ABU2FVG7_9EURY|nr:hypothetical protein [Halomicroarcula sp. S3CR25-11]MDS0284761.1 hypothetical protein [Halomicroarcula sp. S3CR25-11]
MSTAAETPVAVQLTVLVGVSIGAALIAHNLLGYLSTTSAGPNALAWWVPLLSFGMPLLVVAGVLVWLYGGSGR